MPVVGIIPARRGSKGIPRKNFALCAGRPLISYTIESARNSNTLDRLFVSTDDEEIAEYCRAQNVGVPFLRPEALSGDNIPMIDVLKHFLDWSRKQSISVDAIVLLQPTSPLRTSLHIDEAIHLFKEKGADILVSTTDVPHNFSPESLMKEEQDHTLVPRENSPTLSRQQKSQYVARNGPAVLILTPKVIDSGRIYDHVCIGYKMDRWSSIDVDDIDDLKLAEILIENKGKIYGIRGRK